MQITHKNVCSILFFLISGFRRTTTIRIGQCVPTIVYNAFDPTFIAYVWFGVLFSVQSVAYHHLPTEFALAVHPVPDANYRYPTTLPEADFPMNLTFDEDPFGFADLGEIILDDAGQMVLSPDYDDAIDLFRAQFDE